MLKIQLECLKLKIGGESGDENIVSLVEKLEELAGIKNFDKIPFGLACRVATIKILEDIDMLDSNVDVIKIVDSILHAVSFDFVKWSKKSDYLVKCNSSAIDMVDSVMSMVMVQEFENLNMMETEIATVVDNQFVFGDDDAIRNYIESANARGCDINIVGDEILPNVFPEDCSEVFLSVFEIERYEQIKSYINSSYCMVFDFIEVLRDMSRIIICK